MKLTNTQLKELIKEEFEAVISETEGSNKWSFIAVYRTYLTYQGLEDQQAGEVAEQVWNSLSSNPFPMDEVIKMIGEKNKESFNNTEMSPTRPTKRSWHGPDQSDTSGYYHGSRNEE